MASDVIAGDDASSIEPSLLRSNPSHNSLKRTSGTEGEHKDSDFSHPIETVGRRKSAGGSGWKWIVGIVGIIVVIWIFNTGEQYTNRSPNTAPTPRSFESRTSRSTLAGEIENGKTRAKQMEVQINEMDNRLEDYERRMKSYRASGMTDDYNILVPSFNLLVGERNDLYQQYSSLIDEVNSKVKRYNSG